MNRWVVNRVGLLNFWYYQNQIFQLADGRMLLRGTNGSGKSLTMQSLFPVLFDGNTNANRLDSFGSSDRKMEDYLLGEKGVSGRDEGTGYLFLEVKRENRDEYLTIGIGMSASRGGKLKKWFFAIENNQRVGIDFELYEELRKDEITPLTKKKLSNHLVERGRLFDSQREYKQFVNERIFGFEDIEQFEELIALLINLRSPKLSKEFRPSVIYGILRGSLPKLKDDELLTLSKTIEQLDGHRERLEDLSNEIRELGKFTKAYQGWQQELIGQISGKWLQLAKEKQQLTSVTEQQTQQLEQNNKQLTENKAQQTANNIQLSALEQSIQELSQHEGMNLVHRGQELQEQLTEICKRLLKSQEQLTRKQFQLTERQNQLLEQQQKKTDDETELEVLLSDNEQYLSYLRFAELDDVYAKKMRTVITKEEYHYWREEVQKKKNHFKEAIEKIRQVTQLHVQFTGLSREAAAVQQQVDELDRDLRQWQQTRQAEVETWKEEIEQWRRGANFTIEGQSYADLLYRMDQLLVNDIREETVLEPLRDCYEAARSVNQQLMIPLSSRLKELAAQQEEKERGINEWQAQKMPEPSRRESRKVNRQTISPEISYLSFYQGVDFLETISQEERDKLEGALLASGILDGLISKEGLRLADDLQIIPQPQFFTATLADFLKVNDEIAVELQPLVADVLQSIMVDEINPELPTIFRDGSYQLANLKGAMLEDYQASYIGVASQERYRQQMISRLQAEIQEIKAEKVSILEQLELKKQLEKTMKHDYDNCPRGEQVYQSISYLNEIQLKRQTKQEQLEEKEQQANLVEQQLLAIKVMLHELTSQNGLTLDEETYQEAIHYGENYEANLAESYRIYGMIQGQKQMIDSSNQMIQLLVEEVREYFIEEDEGKGEQQKYQRLVEENQKQQKLINVIELQEQLAIAKSEQKKRKKQAEDYGNQLMILTETIATIKVELATMKTQLATSRFKEGYWRQLLEKELNQVINDDNSLKKIAKENMRDENFNKIRHLESNILTQFNFVGDQLRGYQPQLLNTVGIELSEEMEQELGEFAQYNHYKQPRFTSDGQKQSTFELLKKLTSQQITLRDLLKKDDEELFKTIILESVGNILRGRIQHGMTWVEQMNQLLQSQKNSSGLSLSIHWKPVPSASDKDLVTARLVELLEKPIEILSEKDRQSISHHFQEKVYYAQEQLIESQDDNNTLFQAIAQALDYRDWFEFEMKFKRANEGYSPQVLSDRKFNQFSGGEKAVSMYLPLFAAVYSRYQDAGKDCPKVVTLDEAFAGIDDENIAELFKACEQLGFNYVMNSQALFGDYPTVSSLMIYELLRPQNINLVTAIRYYWDGRKKQLVLEESDG